MFKHHGLQRYCTVGAAYEIPPDGRTGSESPERCLDRDSQELRDVNRFPVIGLSSLEGLSQMCTFNNGDRKHRITWGQKTVSLRT